MTMGGLMAKPDLPKYSSSVQTIEAFFMTIIMIQKLIK